MAEQRTVHIAILGFSDFERSALAAQLERVWRRDGRYRHVLAIDDADLVVADADQPDVLDLLQRIDRIHDAVFVGAQPPGVGAAWMMRPIDSNRVLKELDGLRLRRKVEPLAVDSGLPTQPDVYREAPRGGAFSTPTAPPLRSGLRTIGTIEQLALTGQPGDGLTAGNDAAAPGQELPADAAPPLPAGAPNAAALPTTDRTTADPAPIEDPAAERARRRSAALQARLDRERALTEERRRQRLQALRPRLTPRVLLVDDSEVALQFLRLRLVPYGLSCDCATNADQAQDLLSRQTYGMVFLDVDLGPSSRLDGLDLCHGVCHRGQFVGDRAPVVVMVSAEHGPVQRVRGTLAGAQSFLGKPLDRMVLDALLQELGFNSAVPIELDASTAAAAGSAPAGSQAGRPSRRPTL